MKKHIILLSAAGLLFSSCGVYTKYKPATEVPDGLYGEEMAAFTESLAGSPAATEDSLDLGLGGMDWHELFTDHICRHSSDKGCRTIPTTSRHSSAWRKPKLPCCPQSLPSCPPLPLRRRHGEQL